MKVSKDKGREVKDHKIKVGDNAILKRKASKHTLA